MLYSVIFMKIEFYVRKIRNQRRMTIEELSAISGVSRSAIILIEKGKADPKLSTVISIAKALRVEPNELYDYKI